MKRLTVIVMASALAACGGGGGGGGSSKSSTPLAFGSADLSDAKQFAVVDSVHNDGSSDDPSLLVRSSSGLGGVPTVTRNASGSASSSEDSNGDASKPGSMVAQDVDGFVKAVFPSDLNVEKFAVPTKLRDGTQYVAAAGKFLVESADGEVIPCTVLASELKYDERAECIHSSESGADAAVGIGTIREYAYPDKNAEEDALYYSVNNPAGGFSIMRYQDGSTSEVESSETGRIDTMIYGDGTLFAYDSTGKHDVFTFGNVMAGFYTRSNKEYGIVNLESPLLHDKYVIYPRRVSYEGEAKFVNSTSFDTVNGSTFSKAEQYAPVCSGPETPEQIASHNGGLFWIGQNTKTLCELYDVILEGGDERRPNHEFREVSSSSGWSHVKYSNGVLVGVIKGDDSNTLVVDSYEYEQRSQRFEYSINDSDKKFEADIDEVIGLLAYKNGVIVEGTKDGAPVVRYCNTQSGYCDFNVDAGVQVALKDERKFN